MKPTGSQRQRMRDRLLQRIHRQYTTVDESIVVGTTTLALTRVADPDAVLDAVIQQEDDRKRGIPPRRPLRMPYWASLWESAFAVATYLADRDPSRPLAGKSALDLGCGMGVAGMALASLGAATTLVDIDRPALLFARLNTLPWDCRVKPCDWQADDLKTRFDIIVGSDVLYEVDQWPYVEAFLRRHLAPEGVAIIGEPGRPKAEVFPDWIRARGWSLTTRTVRHPPRDVNIHELSL